MTNVVCKYKTVSISVFYVVYIRNKNIFISKNIRMETFVLHTCCKGREMSFKKVKLSVTLSSCTDGIDPLKILRTIF